MAKHEIGILINSRLEDDDIYGLLQPISTMKYTATRQLGRGSEGIVFMARDDTDKTYQTYVAIKVVNKKQCPENALGERWYWPYLRHQNVLRICEKFTFGNLVYYVMELSHNSTLLEWIQERWIPAKRSSLPNEEILKKWTWQLVQAVEYLHERGLYHLDIKPDNIFLDGKWHIKLGDFGFLRSKYDKSVPLTLGCPGYMPPEGLEVPIPLTLNLEKVDIWSTGVTIYELLTGRVIGGQDFGFLSVGDLQRTKLASNLRRNWDTVTRESFSLYPAGHDLVLRMLRWYPDDRPSASQVLKHPWLRLDMFGLPITSIENEKNVSVGLWTKIYSYLGSLRTEFCHEVEVSPHGLHSCYCDCCIKKHRGIKRKRATEAEAKPAKKTKWTGQKSKAKRAQRKPRCSYFF